MDASLHTILAFLHVTLTITWWDDNIRNFYTKGEKFYTVDSKPTSKLSIVISTCIVGSSRKHSLIMQRSF